MITTIWNDIGQNFWNIFTHNITLWTIIGLFGQAMFTGRFFLQWLASERAGRSVFPISFWFLSLAGGGVLLAYALVQKDLVFILGQAFGVFIYTRNLMFVLRERRQNAQLSTNIITE